MTPRPTFGKSDNPRLFAPCGLVQNEYVEAPDGLLRKTGELKKYFAASHAEVSGMKPKATTKRKKPA